MFKYCHLFHNFDRFSIQKSEKCIFLPGKPRKCTIFENFGPIGCEYIKWDPTNLSPHETEELDENRPCTSHCRYFKRNWHPQHPYIFAIFTMFLKSCLEMMKNNNKMKSKVHLVLVLEICHIKFYYSDVILMHENISLYIYPWPTINIRPLIMHFRRLAFSYTEVIY